MAMDEESIPKTAFRVGSGGLYEFTRMPYGLVNAPASFQRLMDAIFGDRTFLTLLIYLDDLLPYAKDFKQMLDRLEMIFLRLRKHGLKLKASKFKLFMTIVEYLGHLVGEKGIQVNPSKGNVIKEWKIPNSEKELRSFLGLAGYFRRFLKSFASITKPLTDLLGPTTKRKTRKVKHDTDKLVENDKRNFKEKWTKECTIAFNTIKQALVSAPILRYPDFTKFVLEIDASFKGLGAVLYQQQDEQMRAIAYASRGLRPNERNMENYSSMKLELLALKWAITDKFRDYLLGSKCTVHTDNNPLCYLQTAKLSAVELRLISQLAQFDFVVKYKSGSSNKAADALSRRHVSEKQFEYVDFIKVAQQKLGNTPLYPELVNVIQDCKSITECQNSNALVNQSDKECYWTLPSINKHALSDTQRKDPILGKIFKYIEKDFTRRDYFNENIAVRKLLQQFDRIAIKNEILYRKIYKDGEERFQLLLPQCLKETVLRSLHDDLGHQGIERTLALVQLRCYWYGMTKDITEYCKQCERCRISKGQPQVKSKMGTLHVTRPLEVLAIDFILMDKSSCGKENVLIMTDVFTKFTQAVVTTNQKAKTVAQISAKE